MTWSWQKMIEAGSPPCLPQIPTFRSSGGNALVAVLQHTRLAVLLDQAATILTQGDTHLAAHLQLVEIAIHNLGQDVDLAAEA